MKKLTLREMESFLNWNSEGRFDHETQFLSKANKRCIVRKMFSAVKDIANLLEAYYDTSVFRREMKIVDHDYSAVAGSNYDKMLVEFREILYVVDDRENYVVIYNGENGFR